MWANASSYHHNSLCWKKMNYRNLHKLGNKQYFFKTCGLQCQKSRKLENSWLECWEITKCNVRLLNWDTFCFRQKVQKQQPKQEKKQTTKKKSWQKKNQVSQLQRRPNCELETDCQRKLPKQVSQVFILIYTNAWPKAPNTLKYTTWTVGVWVKLQLQLQINFIAT